MKDSLLFVPRPPVVEATQYVGEWDDKLEIANEVALDLPWLSPEEIADPESVGIYWASPGDALFFKTPIETGPARDGDWIIKDAWGVYTVMTAQDFNIKWKELGK